MNIDKVVSSIMKMGYHVELKAARKGSENCIAIVIGNQTMRPMFYVKELEIVKQHHDLSDVDVAKLIVDRYLKALETHFNYEEILNFNSVKKNLRLGLRQTGYPDGVFSVPFLDLELYIFIDLPDKNISVTESLISYWEICKEDILNIAKEASKKTLKIASIKEFLMEIIEDVNIVKCINNNKKESIYVARSNDGFRGASAMYYIDSLVNFANTINDDLFLLPHTTEEVFIIPCSIINYDECDNFFKSMVNALPKQDNLANHIYKLVRSENRIIY